MSDADDEHSDDDSFETCVEYNVNVVIHWMDVYSCETQLFLEHVAAYYLQLVWRRYHNQRDDRKSRILNQWYTCGFARL